jgi:hypothetical protein
MALPRRRLGLSGRRSFGVRFSLASRLLMSVIFRAVQIRRANKKPGRCRRRAQFNPCHFAIYHEFRHNAIRIANNLSVESSIVY